MGTNRPDDLEGVTLMDATTTPKPSGKKMLRVVLTADADRELDQLARALRVSRQDAARVALGAGLPLVRTMAARDGQAAV